MPPAEPHEHLSTVDEKEPHPCGFVRASPVPPGPRTDALVMGPRACAVLYLRHKNGPVHHTRWRKPGRTCKGPARRPGSAIIRG